jgi:hypothetical protein
VADLRRLLRLDSAGIADQVREAAVALGLAPSSTSDIVERAQAV